jgi:hypothetical protein
MAFFTIRHETQPADDMGDKVMHRVSSRLWDEEGNEVPESKWDDLVGKSLADFLRCEGQWDGDD